MINRYTEQEAKEKWCPHVRLGANNHSSYNRVANFFNENPKESFCLGSRCMMWVWEDCEEFAGKLYHGRCGLVK